MRKMSELCKMLSFESKLGLNVRFESKCNAGREGGGLFIYIFLLNFFTSPDEMALGLTELTLI